MILGMDPIIFVAWIGAILSGVLCIAYGIYYEFFKKDEEEEEAEEQTNKMQKPEAIYSSVRISTIRYIFC